MLTISIKKPSLSYVFIGLILAYLFILFWFLPSYFRWDVNLYAGLLLAPFISGVTRGKYSLRYLLPCVLALVLASFIPVKTLFFIAVLFAVLFLIENSLGKLSEAFMFLLFLISPVFKYLIATVDFPIRLWLTTKVVDLLNGIGIKAIAAGSQIEMERYSFVVDPACAGLNMLIISLIICLFLLMHFQKQTGKRLNLMYMSALFVLTIGLNIFSNFFRILLLVVFKIMPGTFYHDFVGIACLLIYVVLPLVLGMKPLLNILGKDIAPFVAKTDEPKHSIRFSLLHSLILLLLIFIGSNMTNMDTLSIVNTQIQLSDFKKQQLENGISKFENKETLIYIKPAPFYVPGHDPKLCWTGSGYTFKNIIREKIAGIEVYTALLTKGKDRIYAAWWFDDGRMKTVDQILWRWTSAKESSRFFLVNVNTMNRKSLDEQVAKLLTNTSYLIEKR